MKEVNKYYKSYTSSDKKIDHLKYGLCNEYGPSLTINKETYKEENIIKKR